MTQQEDHRRFVERSRPKEVKMGKYMNLQEVNSVIKAHEGLKRVAKG